MRYAKQKQLKERKKSEDTKKASKNQTASQSNQIRDTSLIKSSICKIYDNKITLFKRRSSQNWNLRIWNGSNWWQRTCGTPNLQDAKIVAQDLYHQKFYEKRLDVGIPRHKTIKEGGDLFKDISKKFHERVIKQESKTHGRETHDKTYRVRLKHLEQSKSLGHLRIRNIRTNDIHLYIEERQNQKPRKGNLHGERTSDKTISHELTALRRVFRFAEDEGQINRERIPRFPQLIVIRTHRLWFSPEQLKLILQRQTERIKECDKSNNLNEHNKWSRWQLYDAMLFVLHSGLRPSELYNMRYSDIQWNSLVNNGNELDRGFLKLTRSKTQRSHLRKMVQFNYGAVRALMRLKERPFLGRVVRSEKTRLSEVTKRKKNSPPAKDDFIFPYNLSYALSDLLEEVDLRHEVVFGKKCLRSMYSFRHTYISNQLMGGAEAWVVAENCGTSFNQIQNHYIRGMGPEYHPELLQKGKVEELTKERLTKEKKKQDKLQHGKQYKEYEKLKQKMEQMKKEMGIDE